MSTDDELTPREHNELRDLVLAGTQRIRPARTPRMQLVAGGVALLFIGAVAGGSLTTALRYDSTPDPLAPRDSSPTAPAANGWVAFAAGSRNSDIHLVREGLPAHRVGGSESDDVEDECPAFSHDGSRLAYGQGTGDAESRWEDAALIIGDVSAEGELSAVAEVPLDGMSVTPCPIWSEDGRWIAFGAGTYHRLGEPHFVDEVWLLDTETRGIRRLTGLEASDLEWAPDVSDLYITSESGIQVYSVTADQTRSVPDTADAVALAVSPDGESLAVQRARGGWGSESRADLWLMAADGSDQRLLVADYGISHGIGPVWSPDGNRVAFQRSCDTYVNLSGSNQRCREESEVVVVPVGDEDPLGAFGTEAVLPHARTTHGDQLRLWMPGSVSWSPDSTTLLYLAWSQADDSESGAMEGVVAVRVDGSAPPVVLHEEQHVTVYSGFPLNTFQSWGRQRG